MYIASFKIDSLNRVAIPSIVFQLVLTATNPTLRPADGTTAVVKPGNGIIFNFTIDSFNDATTCVSFGCGVDDTINLYYGTVDACRDHVLNATPSTVINELENVNPINCTYKLPGTFGATALVYDIMNPESINVTYNILVTSTDCDFPIAEIQEGAADFRSPQQFELSQAIELKGKVTIPCSIVKNNEKLWKVWKVDPTTGEDLEEVDLSKFIQESY